MADRFNPPNRSREYRQRAVECQEKAEATGDEAARALFLQDAETWNRMAAWEDVHNPPQPTEL